MILLLVNQKATGFSTNMKSSTTHHSLLESKCILKPQTNGVHARVDIRAAASQIHTEPNSHVKNSQKPEHRRMIQSRKDRREQHWYPLRDRLRRYLELAGHGAQKFLADRLGVNSSQIHRFSCPKCEHDAEPTYALGVAMDLILRKWEDRPFHFFTKQNRKYQPIEQQE